MKEPTPSHNWSEGLSAGKPKTADSGHLPSGLGTCPRPSKELGVVTVSLVGIGFAQIWPLAAGRHPLLGSGLRSCEPCSGGGSFRDTSAEERRGGQQLPLWLNDNDPD